MPIPCDSCQMPSSCTKDRHCNRPTTLDYAMREYAEAAHALKAAVERAGQALAGVQAAIAIEKGRQG